MTSSSSGALAASKPGLNAVLLFDAATCGLLAVALFALTAEVALLAGLPLPLVLWAGALLVPSAVLMFVAGRQRRPATPLVALIVAGNLAWVLASFYVAFAVDGVTAIGRAAVLVQAVAVAVLAALEWRGLASR